MIILDTNNKAKLYINYEGLFKLIKIKENGDESILKIIDKKGAVSMINFPPHYNLCADFIKNTTVCCFPKAAILATMSNSQQFNLNFIQLLTNATHELMLITEILQLKSAKEKVGWYLSTARIKHDFKLPYSKSLIAAYLGIKPESFSRALSELKITGVQLDKKTIKLIKGDELCMYCDKVTGSKCQSFLTEKCTHTR
jgi:CRP-like cAMP-binding protein